MCPSQDVIEREARDQEERKSFMQSADGLAEASRSSQQGEKPNVPLTPGRGFAFSSSDETGQIMWEKRTASMRSLSRRRSSQGGSSGLLSSHGSTGAIGLEQVSAQFGSSERGTVVAPSDSAASMG